MTHGGHWFVRLNHSRKVRVASSLIREASTSQSKNGLWKHYQIHRKINLLPGILPGTHVDLIKEALQALERRETLSAAQVGWQGWGHSAAAHPFRSLAPKAACFLARSSAQTWLWGTAKGSPHGGADVFMELEKSACTVGALRYKTLIYVSWEPTCCHRLVCPPALEELLPFESGTLPA